MQTEQLQQAPQQSQWSKYIVQPKQAQQAAPEQSIGQKAAGIGGAIVGGISSAGADILETGTNAALWLAQKAGIADPKIADQAKKDISRDLSKWFRTDETSSTDDFFTKSYMENPGVGAVSRAATNVGALATAPVGAIKPFAGASTAAKIGNTVANTASKAAVAGVTSAGIAGTDTEAQDSAAMFGAALTPAVGLAGYGIKKLGEVPLLKDKLRVMTANMNKALFNNNQLTMDDKAAESITNYVNNARQIETQNYEAIKGLKGVIDAKPIQSQLKGLLESSGSVYDKNIGRWNHANSVIKDQADKLQGFQLQATQMKTMEDAIMLKQDLASASRFFKPGEVNTPMVKGFRQVKDIIDSAIETKAKEAGMEGAWKAANKFHKDIIEPLKNFGADDIASAVKDKANLPEYATQVNNLIKKNLKSPQQLKAMLSVMDESGSKIIEQQIIKSSLDDLIKAPESFNKNRAMFDINQNISKFKDVLSKDSIKALKGVRKTLASMGASPVKDSGTVSNVFAEHMIGGSIGAGLGGAVGSVLGPAGTGAGAAIGAGIGVASAGRVMQNIKNVLESPIGISVFKGIADGKPWATGIRNLIIQSPALDMRQQEQIDPAQAENRGTPNGY
jgi:hypothetical protein